jgi:hypothetical protein
MMATAGATARTGIIFFGIIFVNTDSAVILFNVLGLAIRTNKNH